MIGIYNTAKMRCFFYRVLELYGRMIVNILLWGVKMKDYVKIKCVNANKVNDCLSQGWEVIETTKEWTGHGEETKLEYHVGLSASVLLEKYKKIVQDYEKYGYKEKLFESIAESNGKNIEDYEQTGGFIGIEDEVSRYMTNYNTVTDSGEREYTLTKDSKEKVEGFF